MTSRASRASRLAGALITPASRTAPSSAVIEFADYTQKTYVDVPWHILDRLSDPGKMQRVYDNEIRDEFEAVCVREGNPDGRDIFRMAGA